MKTKSTLRAGVLLMFAQFLLSWSQVAHAQTGGSVTPMTGGGRILQMEGMTYVLENQVMRVASGKLMAVNPLPGDTGLAAPVCGAFYNGRKQPDCGTQPAWFESAAQGSCPAGSFFDIGRWSCWTCPPGFSRGGAAVDSDRACERVATAAERGNRPEFQPAQQVGERCPAGAFYDTIGGGSCWSCPSGYSVNVLVHVQAADKCTKHDSQEFSRANRHQRTSFAWDCTGGRFWDIWDGGNCWSCPPGFNRNGNHINANNACDRLVKGGHARATQRSGGNCEAGTFPHVYNFGLTTERTVCLKCPEGYDQVILEAGDSPRKCQTTTRLVFSPAEQKAALTCKPGQLFDFIGLSQQDISSRRQFQSGARPQPVASGTCWSCPPGYYRTLAGVKGDDACGSSGIDYYFAIMREPGLFGLGGAAEVLAEILAQDAQLPPGLQGMVVQAITKMAVAAKIPAASMPAYIHAEARKLATDPQSSGVASALVFARLLTALADESKATAAERRLVASFTQYVKMKRLFMARIALAQYNAWAETSNWRDKNQGGKVFLERATMSAVGRPPNFEEAALLTAAGQGALGMVTSEVVGRIKIPVPMLGEVASLAVTLATGGYEDYTKGIETALHTSARTAGEIVFGVALTTAIETLVTAAITKAVTTSAITAAAAGAGYSSVAVGSSIAASTALAASGIGIAVGAVMIVISMQLEQLNEFLDAPVKVNALLAQARETSKNDLVRMGKTGGGMTELLTYWSAATEAGSQLTSAQKTVHDGLAQKHGLLKTALASSSPAATAAQAAAFTWGTMPGKANDISVGANGSIWHIGTEVRSGGYGIYRWVNNTWQNVAGGAVKVAVDPQGNAWVANDKQVIYRWNGSSWVQMPGLAREIAIGANGAIWVIGTNPVGGGYGIYRWVNNNAWQNLPGGAVKVAVDPQGNAWVANDKQVIYRWNGSSWVQMPGLAHELGVGANGTVWALGTNSVSGGYGLWWWNNGSWSSAPGGLTVLSVGPDGRVVGANNAKDIYRMQ